MMWNHCMDAVFFLYGVLGILADLGGLLALIFLGWLLCTRHGRAILSGLSGETRCGTCGAERSCPAAYSGVLYPCPYYEKEENRR